jgi:hypothetical protein
MDERECCERDCMRDCKEKCFDECYCERDSGINIIWILVILYLVFCNKDCGKGGGLFGGLF